MPLFRKAFGVGKGAELESFPTADAGAVEGGLTGGLDPVAGDSVTGGSIVIDPLLDADTSGVAAAL